MMYEVRRLLALEVLNTAGKIKPRIDPRLPDGQWSEELLSTLTAVISSNRATIKSGFISRWQDNCTSYKDARSAISAVSFAVLYALLGAALCDLRCRFGGPDNGCLPALVGRAARVRDRDPLRRASRSIYVASADEPTTATAPVVAFLRLFLAEIFASRLDWQLEKLLCCPMMRAEYPSLP